MRPLADSSVAELLASVAERTPAPGGGSSLAVGCALGASLVGMAAAFVRPLDARAVARAAELRARALELADEDLSAYAGVLQAGDEAARDIARSAAADCPLEIARVGSEVACLGAALAATGSPQLVGDAVAGALLGEACARAAARLVEINLADRPRDDRHETAAELVQEAAGARLRALEVSSA